MNTATSPPLDPADADALEHYSAEFVGELADFVDPVHFALMRVRQADPVEAARWIKDAVEEARQLFRVEGFDALVRRQEERQREAGRVLMSVAALGLAEPAVVLNVEQAPNEDHGVQSHLVWPGGLFNSYGPVEGEPLVEAGPLLTEEELGPAPGYWRRRIEERAAAYVLAQELDEPFTPPGRNVPRVPRTVLHGTAADFRPDAAEQARQIAARLTARETPDRPNPDRLRYRLQQKRGDGPHYPSALLEAVAEEMNTSPASARRNLVKSGFTLPRDLRAVLVPQGK